VTWRFNVLLDFAAGPTELFFGARLTAGERLSGSFVFDPHTLRLGEPQLSNSITFYSGHDAHFEAVMFFNRGFGGTSFALFGRPPDDLKYTTRLDLDLIDETSRVFADGVGHRPPPLEAFTKRLLTFVAFDPDTLDQPIPPNPLAPIALGGSLVDLSADPAPIPEPGTLLLFATGVAGIAARHRRREHE
jgi:hypothetical protein